MSWMAPWLMTGEAWHESARASSAIVLAGALFFARCVGHLRPRYIYEGMGIAPSVQQAVRGHLFIWMCGPLAAHPGAPVPPFPTVSRCPSYWFYSLQKKKKNLE